MKLVSVSCLLFFVGFSAGFIPGLLRQFGDWSSITHRFITRAGLWSTVVEFLKDNPKYANEKQIPGKLLKSLKLPELFEGQIPHWLSGLIKSSKFEDAVKEVENANVKVDSKESKFTVSHFDAEQFRRSSYRLILLKRKVIALINKAGDNEANYATARKEAGRFLHTLQDFYSHSNWVEFGKTEPFDILGDKLIPEGIIAGKDEKTCKSCTYAKIISGQKDDCHGNLILTINKLTSGYFGGQDVPKPVSKGKCSHGGWFDSSRDEEATGGINKDSNLRYLSPHYRHHKKAAQVAIKATKLFFDSIRKSVGDKKFAKFLNMEAFRTISFAIDTTGSMAGEIAGVQKATIQFIEDAASNDEQSFYYVLVPFNDPEYGPAYVTSDPDVAKAKVQSLRADGGGDCPELGMHGLYLALVHSLPGSDVYYFSDASPKDIDLTLSVISLALEKKCKIYPFVSGRCASKKRKRRSLSQDDVYETLASSTGGQYLEYSKRNIDDVIKLLRPPNVSDTESSLTYQEVTLMAVQVNNETATTGKPYVVKSDSTISSMTAVLSAESNANIQVILPPGSNQNVTIITQTGTVYAVRITKPPVGSWTFKISAFGKYTLRVTAESTLAFSTSLEEEQDSETFEKILVPISGNPIKGQTLFVTVVPSQADVLHANKDLTGYIIDLAGNQLESFALKRGEQLYNNSFYGSVKMDYDQFKISYQGYSKNSEIIKRLRPGVIKPQKFDINVKLVSGNSSLELSPNEITSFNVTLKNYGPKQTFLISVSDEKSFIKSYWPKKISLKSNKSMDIQIIFLVPADTNDTTTSSVSVSASVETSSSSTINVANFLSFEVSVFSKDFLFINETEVTSDRNFTGFLTPGVKEKNDTGFPTPTDNGLPIKTYVYVLIAFGAMVILTIIVTVLIIRFCKNSGKTRTEVGQAHTNPTFA